MLFNQGLELPEILSGDDIHVNLVPERARYSVRVKKAQLAAVKKDSGLTLPAKVGGASDKGDILSICLGPDEWFVSAPLSKAKALSKTMDKVSKTHMMSAVDISHRNVALHLSGPGALAALRAGIATDLDESAFPVGSAMRTAFEAAPVLVYRLGPSEFHIECWRSFAPYMRDFLAIVAKDRQMASKLKTA